MAAGVQERPAIRALTGLRFPAAMAVALHHVSQQWPVYGEGLLPRMVRRVVSEGYASVSFFFVLSGFVLAVAYRDRLARPTRAALWDYGVTRLARFYPVYLLGLALALTVPQAWRALPEGGWAVAGRMALCAVLGQGWVPDVTYGFSFNPVAWTMPLEAFFYATLPLLLWAAARAPVRSPAGWYAAAAGCWAWYVAWAALHPLRQTDGYQFWVTYASPVGRYPEFAAGVCLGLAHAARPPAPARPTWRGTLVEAAALAPLVMQVVLAGRVLPPAWRMFGYYTPTLMLLIAVFARERGWLSAALAGRVPVRLGEASYSFYILHGLLLWQAANLLPLGPGWREAVTVGLMVGAGLACHHGVELPARRWLRGRLRTRPAAAEPAPAVLRFERPGVPQRRAA